MTNRFRSTRYVAAALAIAATVACGGAGTEQPVAGDLQRDLDLAGAAGVVTTASNGVVSAQEQLPHGARSPSVAARPSSNRPRQTTPSVAAAEPVQTVAELPAAEPTPEPVVVTPAPAPAPRPTPVRQPAQRGGTKTVGEVIRDAPFPIFP